MERNVGPPKTRQSIHDHSMIVTPIKKSEAPDFSEARPYQRAGYIRPRRQQFCRRDKPPLSNYWQ
jgi:hypothetical protein